MLRLLRSLAAQDTGGLFSHSAVVADNDAAGSARPVVERFAEETGFPVRYGAEPRRGIALARNCAVALAEGDYLAFIDDDEFASAGWLRGLYLECGRRQTAGALGPVLRHFDAEPPAWLRRGGFYQRPVHPTGSPLRWLDGRTNNALVRRDALPGDGPPFRPQFTVGEDQDFFRRMIAQGGRFSWCAEAVVFEVVPPVRWRRGFMLRRALQRGATSVRHPSFGIRQRLKSLAAVPAYTIVLPFALLTGQHRFMDILVRLCDHLGAVLAMVGVDRAEGAYVTE